MSTLLAQPARDTELLEAVTQIQRSFILGRPAAETFARVLGSFLELTESAFGFIGETFHDEQGQPYLKTHAITNIAWDEATRRFYDENAARGFEFRNLETLFGRVLSSATPLISNSPMVDPRRGGLPPGHPPLNAFLGLPVVKDGVMLGMVGVANRDRGYDQALVDALAPLLATCASLFEARQTEQARRDLTTKLEQTLADLRRSHDNLTAVFDLLDVGVVVLDAEGAITHLSRIGRELVDVDSEVIARPWRQTLKLDPTAEDALVACMKLPERQRSRVGARLEGPRGATVHVELDVRDDPRDSSHRIVFVYDVSDLFDHKRKLDQRHAGLIGRSAVMNQLYDSIDQVAAGDWSVLIEGETGSGKELTAHAIHAASSRASGPFIAVNCAGLTDTLLSSQLFGHVKGAFTGAVSNRQGLFEAACGGTLFLDEIGDISLEMQRSLLRVLQEREITRVGETRPRPIDVRIVAATHRDIQSMVERGEFRSDLMYRIRIVRLWVPPLRVRREDIELLVASFLEDERVIGATPVRTLSRSAMEALERHDWPGNVRELRAAVEHAVAHCRGHRIELRDLPQELSQRARGRSHAAALAPASGSASAERRAPRTEASAGPEREREELLEALREAGGNRSLAARRLGIGRATLYRRMKRHDIPSGV